MNGRRSLVGTLFRHELARFSRNPPAFMLLGVLTLSAVLMASGTRNLGGPSAPAGPMPCWIVYASESPWTDFLKERVPPELDLQFVRTDRIGGSSGRIVYPPGVCAIQILPPARDDEGREIGNVQYHHPPGQANELWPAARWFLTSTFEFLLDRPLLRESFLPIRQPSANPMSDMTLDKILSIQVIGMLLLFSVQFFAACALLVSHTSQDKERGTLHALALSPASPREILVAKLAFHLMLSLGFCGAIIAILQPGTLKHPGFWGILALSSMGFMAIGTLISSIARNQSTASLLSFAYVLAIGTVTFLSARFTGFAWVQKFSFEAYAMGLLHKALDPRIATLSVGEAMPQLLVPTFGFLAILAFAWTAGATVVFVRRGWR